MDFATLIHHGASTGVTGSCHQLYGDADHSLLIDCGLFQGGDAAADTFEQLTVDFDVASIAVLVITHVHIDHIGRLPYLLAAGYSGPILCSRPTAELLPLMLEDALRVGFTRDADLIERFLGKVGEQLVPLDYGQWHTVTDTPDLRMAVRLERAGHILGSAWVKVALERRRDGRRIEKRRVVFSGDLGPGDTPLLPAPRAPHHADLLVLESTYGDRNHERRHERQQRLCQAVERALENGGTVIIPAFSVGRTQELLYELEEIVHSGRGPWPELDIILDSPLAARFTRVYRRLRRYWDTVATRRIGDSPHFLAELGTVPIFHAWPCRAVSGDVQ